MTLEERADLIACAAGDALWRTVRDRALQQLREAAAESWRHGFDAGVVADRDLAPRKPPAFLGFGVEDR